MKKKWITGILIVSAVIFASGCGKSTTKKSGDVQVDTEVQTTTGPTPTLSPMPLSEMEFVAIDEVNIREKADKNADIVGGLLKGERVEVLSDEGDWYKISYEDSDSNKKMTGYAAKQFVNQIHKLS